MDRDYETKRDDTYKRTKDDEFKIKRKKIPRPSRFVKKIWKNMHGQHSDECGYKSFSRQMNLYSNKTECQQAK